jgi:hypothetical protein
VQCSAVQCSAVQCSAVQCRDVNSDVTEEILLLFLDNHGPEKARRIYIAKLKEKHGELGFLAISSNRAINPDKTFYSNLFRTFWFEKLGTLNGPDATQKTIEMVNEYNQKIGRKLASFKINKKNQIIIAVLDKLSERVHQLVPQSGDQVHIDATGTLDQADSQLLKLMCASPAGGLPLGFLILSGKDENLIAEGLEELKLLLPTNAFHKRGEQGPKLFMTDDDEALRNALKKVWPNAKTLLCTWHNLQAAFRWLHQSQSNIKLHDRPHLLKLLQSAIYARTFRHFLRCKQNIEEDPIALQYPQFLNHVYKPYFKDEDRIEAWAHYFRHERNLQTHGNDTNNYVETSFRETKDNQFNRTKCFNVPDLLSVLLDHSDSYKTKLTDLGNNRTAHYRYNKSKYIGKKTSIKKDKITELGGGNFIVEDNVKGKTEQFRLNIYTGFCECKTGSNCGPCQHKTSVSQHFNISGFSIIPEQDPNMRALWHYIAYGRTLSSHMYRGLHDSNKQVLDVEAFINERLAEPTSEYDEYEHENMDARSESESIDSSDESNDNDSSDESNDNETEDLITDDKVNTFRKAWNNYGEKIIQEMQASKNSKDLNKGVDSVIRMMTKSKASNLATITKQLIWFGKEQHTKREHGKIRAKINVQPTALARSKTKRRGRKSTLKGRPHKNWAATSEYVVDENGAEIPSQPPPKKKTNRAKHSFKDALVSNKPPPRRHDRQ